MAKLRRKYGVGIEAGRRIEQLHLCCTLVEAIVTARRLHALNPELPTLVWNLRTDAKIYRIDVDGRWYWQSDAPASRKAHAAGGGGG